MKQKFEADVQKSTNNEERYQQHEDQPSQLSTQIFQPRSKDSSQETE